MRQPVNAFSMIAVAILAAILSSLPAARGEPLPPPGPDSPDLVVVIKSERRLYLYQDGWPTHSYPIALGLNPSGHKLEEGDQRTPEGSYVIDWRNPDSRFYRSLHISYPNDRDRARAAAGNRDPGGMIMIHGQPSYSSRKRSGDWTDGCIAVSDDAMDELWSLIGQDTRIHIYP
ncbi:MAG: hypothetical protein CMN28_01515 [Salinisphaeraceae bacterium]|nr:hypothetical protein [Salinisphaeraceae bacterium]